MGHPRRLEPCDYRGFRAYSLTICTHRRTRPFTDPAIVRLVLSQFLRAATDQRCELLAYCFMPDHVHAVVLANAQTMNFQRFVHLAKLRSGFAFTGITGGRLWQQSYFDRTVRSVEELPGLVGYMIRTPLRAGLVEDPVCYPYWGSERYSREELLELVASAR